MALVAKSFFRISFRIMRTARPRLRYNTAKAAATDVRAKLNLSRRFNLICPVSASPCIDLPPLDEEHPRDRVLTEDEIRTLWHGLDREDMPWDRKTRLAIRFALATMLRSGELLPIHRDEPQRAPIPPEPGIGRWELVVARRQSPESAREQT
jgi:integrase